MIKFSSEKVDELAMKALLYGVFYLFSLNLFADQTKILDILAKKCPSDYELKIKERRIGTEGAKTKYVCVDQKGKINPDYLWDILTTEKNGSKRYFLILSKEKSRPSQKISYSYDSQGRLFNERSSRGDICRYFYKGASREPYNREGYCPNKTDVPTILLMRQLSAGSPKAGEDCHFSGDERNILCSDGRVYELKNGKVINESDRNFIQKIRDYFSDGPSSGPNSGTVGK